MILEHILNEKLLIKNSSVRERFESFRKPKTKSAILSLYKSLLQHHATEESKINLQRLILKTSKILQRQTVGR